MSIKPLGGIFGRNPTFNDVTVEGELTVEGATTYGSNVTINGNLTVNGTETILDVVTLEVEDPNIILGKNNTTDPQADGGGITLKGATNKTIVWSDTNDHWTISDALEVDNLRLDGNAITSTNANGNIDLTPNGTGEVNITKVDIDGGTIDATDITVGAGKTLDVSVGTLSLANDQISGDKVEGGTINAITINTLTSTTVNGTTFDTNVAAAGVTLSGITLSADGTNTNIDINITPKGTGEVNITKVDIDGGTIDGTDVTVGAGKTLNVSAGTLSLANDQISGDKVEGGTINAITINTLTSTTVNGTTFDTNVAAAGVTLSGTTLSADGTDTNIDINITPKGTGEVNITKVDIDAGSMDGVVIGASSRQEATFTRVYAQDPSDSTYYMVLAPQSLSPFGNGSLINYKGSLVLGTMTGNTNPVFLYSNGVEGLRVNGGNTGFGVVDPTSYRLQLASSGDKIGVDLSSGGTTRTSFIEFYAAANAGMTLSTTNSSTGGIKLQTQGADVIEARRDGNVNITNKLGIGSTAPVLQLGLGSPTAGRGISWDTNGAGNYCNIWAGYANGDLVMATNMKGTTATADGFLSSYGSSAPRTAIRLNAFDSDGIQFYASQASTVAVDSAVTPTVQFQVMNDGTGDVKVHNGNVVIGTSGKGIDFSATAGSGTGEILDDYEEGTWTPTYSPASGSFTSITYGFQQGWYRKIGSMVVCTVSMRTSALTVGTASGDVYLDSLPFAAINNTSRPSYAPVAIGSDFVTTNPSGIRVQMNGTTQALIQTGYNNGALQVSNLSTGGANNFLAVTFAYITND